VGDTDGFDDTVGAIVGAPGGGLGLLEGTLVGSKVVGAPEEGIVGELFGVVVVGETAGDIVVGNVTGFAEVGCDTGEVGDGCDTGAADDGCDPGAGVVSGSVAVTGCSVVGGRVVGVGADGTV
jgi:hypothetical protein